MSLQSIIQTILSNLHLVGILALATMGIMLVFKTSFTTNFAQGMMATIGVFTAATLITKFGFNRFIAIGAGILISFIIGILIDTIIIRKAKNINVVGKQMITMGLVIVITAIIPIVFGTIPLEFGRFFDGNLNFAIAGMNLFITKNGLFIVVASTIIISIVYIALNFTKWGLGVRSTAANETVASMMGVNTKVITAMSWSIAGALGAIAAIFLASQNGSVEASMMVSTQVNGFLASVLGGFFSFYGPLVGAALIPICKSLIAIFSGVWSGVILYTLVLLVVLIKPVGLFGKKISKKV